MPDNRRKAIGKLRWLVMLGQRQQVEDTGTGITEAFINAVPVHADIQPVGPLTFWGASQVETPVSHRITLRWQPYLDNTYAIERTTTLPNGSTRSEVFRVRRIAEDDGRKRFVTVEAQMDTPVVTQAPA